MRKRPAMRLALLTAALLTLGVVWSAPAPIGSQVPQALAGGDSGCPGLGGGVGAGEGAEEARHVKTSGNDSGSGGDEDAPPKFSRSFYHRWFSIDTSTDGFEPPDLPVSIEEVGNDLPRRLRKQASQLNGSDGVVVVTAGTRVWKDGLLLSGQCRLAELDGADSALMKVHLLRPKRWREDEDGNSVATFRARRIEITD